MIYDGQPIDDLPTAERVRRGIAPVPEARRLFPRMTVSKIWRWAPTRAARSELAEDLERVSACSRASRSAASSSPARLSGGEQQMVAIGRALMARPAADLHGRALDGPVAALRRAGLRASSRTINKQGTTIFVVEQNANMALSIADRGYVLQTGEVVLSGTAAELRREPEGARGLSRRNAGD